MREVILVKNQKKIKIDLLLKIFKEHKIEAIIKRFCSYFIIYTERPEEVINILGKEVCLKVILWNIEEIDNVAKVLSEYVKNSSFAVLVEKRSSHLSSQELKSLLGNKIAKISNAIVDLKTPKIKIALFVCGKTIFTHLYS